MLTRDTNPTKLSASWTVNSWESESTLVDEMLEISSKNKQILDLEIFVKDVKGKAIYRKTSANQNFNLVSEENETNITWKNNLDFT